jgi:hypothetical protein
VFVVIVMMIKIPIDTIILRAIVKKKIIVGEYQMLGLRYAKKI